MKPNGKAEMISALRDFKNAYGRVNRLWIEGEIGGKRSGVVLDNTTSISNYPFTISFDELQIPRWCDTTIKELNAGYDAFNILNPKCAKCAACTIAKDNDKMPYFKCVADIEDECASIYVPFDREVVLKCLLEAETDLVGQMEVKDIVRYGYVGLNDATETELIDEYTKYIIEEDLPKDQMSPRIFKAALEKLGWEYYDQLGGGCYAIEKNFGKFFIIMTLESATCSKHSVLDEKYDIDSEEWSLETWQLMLKSNLEGKVDAGVANEIVKAYEILNAYRGYDR